MTVRNWAGVMLLVATVVPLSGLALWYGIRFWPYVAELHRISERGNTVASNIEATLYPMVIAGETKSRLRWYAISQAYLSLALNGVQETTTVWQLNTLLWYAASFLHLTDDEIFGIWVDCSIYGCGRGLSELARSYLGIDLAHLTKWQCAQLLAVVKAPSIFVPGSERGDRKARQIIEKFNLQLEEIRGTAQQPPMISPKP